jgi:hypothetical protein
MTMSISSIRLRDLEVRWPSYSNGYDVDFSNLEQQLKQLDVDINPEFQRDRKWTLAQQSSFAGHVLTGGKVAPLLLNASDNRLKFSLLDGKQRVTTMLAWLRNEIPANVKGQLFYFRDTDGKFRIGRGFRFDVVELPEIEALKLYVRINSGVAHTSAELDRVNTMIAEKEAKVSK